MTHDLTAFLISAGHNPNFWAAKAALEAQHPAVLIHEIRNTAPMDRAFQRMLDECTTPYFVQCDCDMVLAPEACRTMLHELASQPDDVAFIAYMLHDPHLGFPIQGVKCYRTDIMRKFPYVAGLSCEKSQLDRLRDAGYKIAERWTVLGEHSPQWTPELIFERYFDLMEKWKRFGYRWLEGLPARLLSQYTREPTENNQYAYLGAAASISEPTPVRAREKDYRVRTPEFLDAHAWHSQPTQATLYLTDRCNLRCGWCLRQGGMAQVAPATDFNPELVDVLLSRFPTLQSICLCGFGETLMAETLPGVIDRCMQRGMWTGLITNGVLLRDKFDMLKEHRPSCISISLNAASRDEHEAETGVVGAWSHVLEGLAEWRIHRNRLKMLNSRDTGISLFLSRVCTAENLDRVEAFLELAAESRVDGVDLHNVLPHDVCTPDAEAEFLARVLTVEHWWQIEDLKQLPVVKQNPRLVRTWPVLIDPKAPVRRCESPFRMVSIDGNGRLGICNSVMPPRADGPHIDDPKVWLNDQFRDFRQMFAADELPPWCKHCFRNFCQW